MKTTFLIFFLLTFTRATAQTTLWDRDTVDFYIDKYEVSGNSCKKMPWASKLTRRIHISDTVFWHDRPNDSIRRIMSPRYLRDSSDWYNSNLDRYYFERFVYNIRVVDSNGYILYQSVIPPGNRIMQFSFHRDTVIQIPIEQINRKTIKEWFSDYRITYIKNATLAIGDKKINTAIFVGTSWEGSDPGYKAVKISFIDKSNYLPVLEIEKLYKQEFAAQARKTGITEKYEQLWLLHPEIMTESQLKNIMDKYAFSESYK
jgi:hypothetical protein